MTFHSFLSTFRRPGHCFWSTIWIIKEPGGVSWPLPQSQKSNFGTKITWKIEIWNLTKWFLDIFKIWKNQRSLNLISATSWTNKTYQRLTLLRSEGPPTFEDGQQSRVNIRRPSEVATRLKGNDLALFIKSRSGKLLLHFLGKYYISSAQKISPFWIRKFYSDPCEESHRICVVSKSQEWHCLGIAYPLVN